RELIRNRRWNMGGGCYTTAMATTSAANANNGNQKIQKNDDRYDLIVIGTGNAGQLAASVARDGGMRVAIVEGRDVGGTCALRGCVPKKVLVAAAEAMDVIRRADTHAITVGTPALDWTRLIARERTFVDDVPAQAVARGQVRGGVRLGAATTRFQRRRHLADQRRPPGAAGPAVIGGLRGRGRDRVRAGARDGPRGRARDAARDGAARTARPRRRRGGAAGGGDDRTRDRRACRRQRRSGRRR